MNDIHYQGLYKEYHVSHELIRCYYKVKHYSLMLAIKKLMAIKLSFVCFPLNSLTSTSASSSSYMALQPISGLGLLFMRFRNLTLIDNW
jgi:hypothetical protein